MIRNKLCKEYNNRHTRYGPSRHTCNISGICYEANMRSRVEFLILRGEESVPSLRAVVFA